VPPPRRGRKCPRAHLRQFAVYLAKRGPAKWADRVVKVRPTQAGHEPGTEAMMPHRKRAKTQYLMRYRKAKPCKTANRVPEADLDAIRSPSLDPRLPARRCRWKWWREMIGPGGGSARAGSNCSSGRLTLLTGEFPCDGLGTAYPARLPHERTWPTTGATTTIPTDPDPSEAGSFSAARRATRWGAVWHSRHSEKREGGRMKAARRPQTTKLLQPRPWARVHHRTAL